MNCIEFRHFAMINTTESDVDYLSHKASCPSCQQFSIEMQEFNSKLNNAVDVKVPDDLATKILFKHSLQKYRVFDHQNQFAFGLAASLFLVIGLTIGIYIKQPPSLDQAVISYITSNMEPRQVSLDVSEQKLTELFNSMDMKYNGNIGQVNYAVRCMIRDKHSLHMVLAGENGPVTIIFMPNDQIQANVTVNNSYFSGIITPCPRGSIAIIGEHGENIEAIHKKIQNQIQWF